MFTLYLCHVSESEDDDDDYDSNDEGGDEEEVVVEGASGSGLARGGEEKSGGGGGGFLNSSINLAAIEVFETSVSLTDRLCSNRRTKRSCKEITTAITVKRPNLFGDGFTKLIFEFKSL